MIGLRRHAVVIAEHEASWLKLGAARCQAIAEACRNIACDVEHVGSTSVPGLPAKPIIDIAIGLADMAAIDQVKSALCPVGYIYRGIGSGAIGHVLVSESSADVRTEHVHVVPRSGEHWDSYVLFRDALRNDPGLRERYADLKRELAMLYPNDRKRYGEGKDGFISAALGRLAARHDGPVDAASQRR